MSDIPAPKLTDEQFKERLINMLKNGDIRIADIPKRFKEAVIKEVYGRYPLKSFSDLSIIIKSKG